MSDSRISVAVIGSGAIAFRSHMPELARLAGKGMLFLHTVCDIDRSRADKAQREFGFMKVSSHAEEVVADPDIDAVYIFGTVEMHYELGKQVLNAGKHLFVEKPPASSEEEVAELSRIAAAQQLVAVAGFNRRFSPGIAFIKKMIDDGLTPTLSEAIFNKPMFDVPAPYGASSWFFANSIHALDTLVYLKGVPEQIASAAAGRGIKTHERYLHAAFCRWADGTPALLVADNAAGEREETYRFHFPNRTYVVSETEVVSQSAGVSRTELTYTGTGFAEEHAEFVRAILDRAHVPVNSLASAAETVLLTRKIEEAYIGPLGSPAQKESPAVTTPRSSLATRSQEDSIVGRKPRVLVLSPGFLKEELARMNTLFELRYDGDDSGSESVDAIITGANVPLRDELFTKNPSLKIVGVVGASVRKYYPESALAHGVPLVSASESYAEAVAEFIVMQAIVGLRRASRGHDILRKGGWGFSEPSPWKEMIIPLIQSIAQIPAARLLKGVNPVLWSNVREASQPEPRPTTRSLSGVVVGIVGFGHITEKVIPRLRALGARVIVHSGYLDEAAAQALGIERASLNDVLLSDVVSLQRGLSARTAQSFGREQVMAMKPGAVFINSSRGGIVDEAALIERLSRGDLYACLDVFADEPLPKNSPLRKLPNVFLTPHIAGSTQEMYADAKHVVIDKIATYLKGESIAHLIATQEQLENMT